ncbi:alpha/beta fold hydrolase [Flavisphingomonas formosensis]|uniref:alpha/beta fold hydrolase n=1 Tax=Flavisphingomonas formosensis TaxID=861534 RepID=UPI0012F74DBA|nr:alpha/beta hydrolase [Sphingomonas formosensis]
MGQLEEHRIATPDGHIHVVAQGSGPVVLMVHGNPGLAYSWRHQMQPLADAGYRAVAIDCLGYGRSDRPDGLEHYDSNAMHRQLLSVLDHFKAARAAIVGQDFGAQYSWNLAVRAPERVGAIAATVPYDYDMAGRGLQGSNPPEDGGDDSMAMSSTRVRPSERYANMARNHFVHVHYYQEVGPAERELGPQLREYLSRILYALSGEGNLLRWSSYPSEGTGYMDVLEKAPPLPWPWLCEAEFERFVQDYGRGGEGHEFAGPLAAYRVADRNWEIGAAWADHDVTQPALFICGAKDPVLLVIGADWRERMRQRIPRLREPVLVPGAGHMVQQEAPEAFNAALLAFLREQPAGAFASL